jgi:hypothetical protein
MSAKHPLETTAIFYHLLQPGIKSLYKSLFSWLTFGWRVGSLSKQNMASMTND